MLACYGYINFCSIYIHVLTSHALVIQYACTIYCIESGCIFRLRYRVTLGSRVCNNSMQICTCIIYMFNMCIYYLYSYLHNDQKIALIGPKVDLTYEYQVHIYMNTVIYNMLHINTCLL